MSSFENIDRASKSITTSGHNLRSKRPRTTQRIPSDDGRDSDYVPRSTTIETEDTTDADLKIEDHEMEDLK